MCMNRTMPFKPIIVDFVRYALLIVIQGQQKQNKLRAESCLNKNDEGICPRHSCLTEHVCQLKYFCIL